MPKRLQKVVLVKRFCDNRSKPEYYNELRADNSPGEWMSGKENINDHLIHPDSDEIILEPGSVVVLERYEDFHCSRWTWVPKKKTVWKILKD